MTDFLFDAYLWIKAFHIMAVLSWMAGLFYLPRLMVYHTERSEPGDQLDETLKIMEFKLQRYIMSQDSIATWVAGLAMVFTPGIVDWSDTWPWVKAGAVIGMTVFDHWLMIMRKKLSRGERPLTGRQFRIANEIPTLLMIAIVLSVILKF